MGAVYKKTCIKCGFEFNTHTGGGFLFPLVYKETVQKAKDGELGKELQNFFSEHADGAVDVNYVVLCCEECCHLNNDMDLTMYIPKTKKPTMNAHGRWSVAMPFEGAHYVDLSDLEEYYTEFAKYPHKCEKCGGKMKKIDDDEKLKCPKCKVPLKTESVYLWD